MAQTQSETIAGRARQIAARIENLPREIIASFASADSKERVAKLRDITSEIEVDMFPVITWIERNRPGADGLVKGRLFHMSNEAVACAGSDIPEYAGGLVNPQAPDHKPSAGCERTAILAVYTKCVAVDLNQWAAEIEAAEQEQQRAEHHHARFDEQLRRLEHLAGNVEADKTDTSTTTAVWYHGQRAYSTDGKLPAVVSNEQHNTLQAFLKAGAALDSPALEKAGVSNISRVMKELKKRFPGKVQSPGSKGSGYFIDVRPLTPTK